MQKTTDKNGKDRKNVTTDDVTVMPVPNVTPAGVWAEDWKPTSSKKGPTDYSPVDYSTSRNDSTAQGLT